MQSAGYRVSAMYSLVAVVFPWRWLLFQPELPLSGVTPFLFIGTALADAGKMFISFEFPADHPGRKQ
tara:strand:+ start:300 stop:500 length:201 start_codon:yes stop_codon:yes gene_type:complete